MTAGETTLSGDQCLSRFKLVVLYIYREREAVKHYIYIFMKLDVDRFLNYMYFDVLKIYPRNVGQYLFENSSPLFG